LIAAFSSFVDQADSRTFAALRPGREFENSLFGLTLDMLIVASAVAWVALLRARRQRGLPLLDAASAGGLTALAVALLLLNAPYRIIWHNEFPRIDLAGARCYLTGETSRELLLFCPEVPPPHNRVVPAPDPRLRRLDVVESMFTMPPGAPKN
jgi:hypothetical protein